MSVSLSKPYAILGLAITYIGLVCHVGSTWVSRENCESNLSGIACVS